MDLSINWVYGHTNSGLACPPFKLQSESDSVVHDVVKLEQPCTTLCGCSLSTAHYGNHPCMGLCRCWLWPWYNQWCHHRPCPSTSMLYVVCSAHKTRCLSMAATTPAAHCPQSICQHHQSCSGCKPLQLFSGHCCHLELFSPKHPEPSVSL